MAPTRGGYLTAPPADCVPNAVPFKEAREVKVEAKESQSPFIFDQFVYFVGRLDGLQCCLSERWSPMMRGFAAFLTAVAVGILSVPGNAAETEYRGRLDLQAPIQNNLNLKMLSEMRSRNDLQTLSESHFEAFLDRNFAGWLALAPGYRHVTEKARGAWRVEHRPEFDATLSWSIRALRMSNRNRLEYRMFEAKKYFRYRFRIQVATRPAPVSWMSAHLSEEPFYDFSAGMFSKNRATAGIEVRVFETIRLNIDYVLDSTKSNDSWTALHAPTLVIKYRQ
jgi:hypothetical protein